METTTNVQAELAAEEVVEEVVAEEPVEEANEEFGFDLEKFRYDGPWPESVPPDEECEVINGGASKASELLSGNTRPVLAMRRYVWEEIQHLVHRAPNSEMAMFLVLKQMDPLLPKFVAVDLHFPKQEAGATGVAIDAPSAAKFYGDLHAHPDYSEHMHSRLCHLHSHSTMECFWSGADTNQQMSRDDLGFYDDFRFYCVVNTRGEIRCCFVQYRPFLRRFDKLPVVILGKPEGLSEERKAELDSWVSERISALKTNVFSDIKTFPADATEEYKPEDVDWPYKHARFKPFQPLPVAKPASDGGDWGGDWSDIWKDIDIGAERKTAWRREKRGGDIVSAFVDFCVTMSPGLSRLSHDDLDAIEAWLCEQRSDTAVELRGIVESMPYLERHDLYAGFMELTDFQEGSVEEIPASLIEWLDWLLDSEYDLNILRPFLRTWL